ncbi:hypothetical protein V6N12_064972 [Hibiscus sabdariffa]|uniref:Uncharacterized protein n=1 Tax=Hibiscus sabdariffa TaxID=183260 RepID=A0ABR2G7B7_9ROSI
MLVATNQTTGHQRGRPSDPVIVVDLPHVFILQSSYVPSELQSAQKKRRGVEVPMSGIDPIDVVTVENGVGGVPVPTTVSTGSEGFTPAIPSFKDKLMGDVGIPRDMQYISELDVEVREENVQMVAYDNNKGVHRRVEHNSPSRQSIRGSVSYENQQDELMVQDKEDARKGVSRLTNEGLKGPQSPRPTMVADMVTTKGRWNWELLQDLLPVEVLDRMATIPTPMSHYGNDVPGWRWSEKRKLSVGSV